MTKLYTYNCPKCNRQQNLATKRREIILESKFFCSCGWEGLAEEKLIKEISQEDWYKVV